MTRIKDVYAWLDGVAPFDTAEEWDNSGLQLGDPEAEVERALLCLDVDAGALERAEAMDAQLVISHHPLLFHPIKTLSQGFEAELLCRMVRGGRGLIAAHTNLDKARGGVNECLLRSLGVEPSGQDGFVLTGELEGEPSAGAFLELVRERLNEQAWFFGDREAKLRRLAVFSGGGGDFFQEAHRLGAQAFLTGEMAHHNLLRARALGLQLFVAGHAQTENVVLSPLAKRLSRKLGICTEIYPYVAIQ